MTSTQGILNYCMISTQGTCILNYCMISTQGTCILNYCIINPKYVLDILYQPRVEILYPPGDNRFCQYWCMISTHGWLNYCIINPKYLLDIFYQSRVDRRLCMISTFPVRSCFAENVAAICLNYSNNPIDNWSNMRFQRTNTKQLRAPLTTPLRQNVCSAISTHVRSIINWIIVNI